MRGIISNSQPGILAPCPQLARYLSFSLEPGAKPGRALKALVELADGDSIVVGFGKSFDAFEAQLKRMVGAEDGITDASFKFTRPVTGSYFGCPPVVKGGLDLRALGI